MREIEIISNAEAMYKIARLYRNATKSCRQRKCQRTVAMHIPRHAKPPSHLQYKFDPDR